jgi:hypothetical protein
MRGMKGGNELRITRIYGLRKGELYEWKEGGTNYEFLEYTDYESRIIRMEGRGNYE